jgi:hypothetical protein
MGSKKQKRDGYFLEIDKCQQVEFGEQSRECRRDDENRARADGARSYRLRQEIPVLF